jgi:hypothetical protein
MKSVYPILILAFLIGCNPKQSTTATSSSSVTTPDQEVRIIFHENNFSQLNDFAAGIIGTAYGCLGDVTKLFHTTGADFSDSANQIPYASTGGNDALAPTVKPAFLKHVSVDMTHTYFPETETTVVQTDSCSHRGNLSAALPNACADFDTAPVAAPLPVAAITPTPVPTPTSSKYYGSGFYRVRDDWCQYQGPILGTGDLETTKLYVGGVNIDLDRSGIDSKEDLLMTITYQSINSSSVSVPITPYLTPLNDPGGKTSVKDQTRLRVQLMRVEQSLDTLLGVKQPRSWAYYDGYSFPVLQRQLATLEDPFGGLRTHQIIVPLSQFPTADRIRIDRVRGSYFLYQVDLVRLGNRSL